MSKRRAAYVIIAVLWAVVMAFFYVRHYGPPGKLAPEFSGVGVGGGGGVGGVGGVGRPEVPESLFGERWMGVYQAGRKIGYANRELMRTEDGYRSSESVFMALRVMGYDKNISITTEMLGDSAFRLKTFKFVMDADVPMKLEGEVRGRELRIKLNVGGAETEQSIPLTEAPVLGQYMLYKLLSGGIEVGKKLTLPVVEPSALTAGDLDVSVVAKEKIFALGVQRQAYKVRGEFKGAEVFLWVSDTGQVLREEAMGFTFVAEPKEDALKVEKPSVDLIAEVAVPVDVVLPEKVQYLKVRLGGVKLDGLELDGGVQSLRGDVLEIRRAVVTGTGGALDDKERYLKETLLIQTRDPAIVSLSDEIAGRASGRLNAAELIYRWVFENIEKVPAITFPSATEVLKSLRGDCNEHTALYTALSRAAGVPTRISVGLAYKEGFFYYHAWPEVYLGGWVPVDPTLGEFPADAAHIRLLTGGLEKQIRLASVVGKLTIQVLDYK